MKQTISTSYIHITYIYLGVQYQGMGRNNAPQKVSVFVNGLTGSNAAHRNIPAIHGVTVTPTTQPPPTKKIDKVLLKVVEKHDKKKTKTFTLRTSVRQKWTHAQG
jgi:hypothetical protein